MKMRQYQKDAANSLYREWWKGNKYPILSLPTGTGKTICMSNVSKHEVEKGNRVCMIIDREELLQQFVDKLRRSTGLECGIERGDSSAHLSPHRIIVASIQSISRPERLQRYSRDFFDLVQTDEAHRSAADSYLRVYEHFHKARRAGYTATIWRNDERSLSDVYDCISYEYTMRQAINDGWLVPIKAQTLPIKIDMSKVRTRIGDYSDKDSASAVEPYLEKIAQEIMNHAPDRIHLIFLPLISTSQKMEQACLKAGFRAKHVDGNSPDREQILKDFESGKYNVLTNSMLLSYGYDNPHINSVVWLRPTQSTLTYVQGIGRGTRVNPPALVNALPTPEARREAIARSAKPDLILLDVLWNSARHRLCHPSVLFAKDDEVADLASNSMSEVPQNIEDMVAGAEFDIQMRREENLAKYIEAHSNKKSVKLDPIEQMLSILNDELVNYQANFDWEKKPATGQQVEYLEMIGFKNANTFNAGYASRIINTMVERNKQNLATPKQIRKLLKFGVDAMGLSKTEASTKLDEIRELDGWKPYKYKMRMKRESKMRRR